MAESTIGVSAADAEFAKAKGSARYATLTDVEHARMKSSDTGAAEPAPTAGLWVRLEPEGDPPERWAPKAKYGEEYVSNKMGTAIREPFVNVSDAATAGAMKTVEVEHAGGVVRITDDGDGIPIERNKDGVWIPYACFFVFKSGGNVERANGTLMGGTNGLGVKLTGALAEWMEVKVVRGGLALEMRFEGGMETARPSMCRLRARACGASAGAARTPEEIRKHLARKSGGSADALTLLAEGHPGEADKLLRALERGRKPQWTEKTGVSVAFALRPEYFTAIRSPGAKVRRQLAADAERQQAIIVETLTAMLAVYLGPRRVAVRFNGAPVAIRCMADVAGALPAEEGERRVAALVKAEATWAGGGQYETQEWEVVAMLGARDGEHVTLVNGTPTYKGPHITALLTEIRRQVAAAAAARRDLKGVSGELTPAQVSAHLKLAVSARIPDADWNDQSKTQLRFPSRYRVTFPARFAKEVAGWLVEQVVVPRLATRKVSAEVLAKVSSRLNKKHVPAYEAQRPRPASWKENVLFIVEGSSAKSMTIRVIIAGKCKGKQPWMSSVRSGFIEAGGVLMNAQRETTRLETGDMIQSAKMQNNIPSQTLLQLLKERRYGHVVIATDADIDGWMIASQVLCFYLNTAPALFGGGAEGRDTPHVYLWQTPVGRTYAGKKVHEYYTRKELAQAPMNGKTKYFKGLGALEPQHDQLLVDAAPARIIPFGVGGAAVQGEALAALKATCELWFGPNVEARKAAIARGVSAEAVATVEAVLREPLAAAGGARGPKSAHAMGPTHKKITQAGYVPAAEFIETTMQEVATEKNRRALKAASDGLYEGTRKSVYAFTLMPAPKESLAVFIRGGEVTSLSGYAHGDACLYMLIMGMGAYGLGMGTMPLVRLLGQAPAREKGIDSAGAPRYVSMKINIKLLRAIFRPDELMPFLERSTAWGKNWEPREYRPVVPYAVMDYASGIGLGWAQRVFARDPAATAAAVRSMIIRTAIEANPRCTRLPPHTRGFRGRWRRTFNDEGEEVERFEARWSYDAAREELVTEDLPYWDNNGAVLFVAVKKRIAAAVARLGAERGWEMRPHDCVINSPKMVIRIPRGDMAPGGFVAQHGGAAAVFRLDVECRPTALDFVNESVPGHVKHYPSHEAVVEEWFAQTRVLYARRRRRTIEILRWQLALVRAQERFANRYESLGLTGGMRVVAMEQALAAAGFKPLNAAFIRNPGTVVDPAEIARCAQEGASFQFLLGMNTFDRAASASRKRRELISRYTAELAQSESDQQPIEGAQLWLRELEEFTSVYEQGCRTGFMYEDAS